MNPFKKYAAYVGLVRNNLSPNVPEKYTPLIEENQELLQKHLDYTKELLDLEQKRQTIIEGKLAQLEGQASIVVSIISLFIPLFIDKINGVNSLIIIILPVGFLFVLFNYCLTVYHVISTLYINKYKYATGSISTITRKSRAGNLSSLMIEQIEDNIYALSNNSHFNNLKGTTLNYAAKTFKVANISFGLFAFFLICISIGVKSIKNQEKITIAKLDHRLDSISKIMRQNKLVNGQEETLILKLSNDIKFLEIKTDSLVRIVKQRKLFTSQEHQAKYSLNREVGYLKNEIDSLKKIINQQKK